MLVTVPRHLTYGEVERGFRNCGLILARGVCDNRDAKALVLVREMPEHNPLQRAVRVTGWTGRRGFPFECADVYGAMRVSPLTDEDHGEQFSSTTVSPETILAVANRAKDILAAAPADSDLKSGGQSPVEI